MWRWFGLGLMAIAVLAAANIAYALTAIGSSAANLSRLEVRNSSAFVDLIPSSQSRAIPVRLKLHGGLWLSGFGRRDWFSGVIEAEELQVVDWDRPWNGDDIRLTLRAERDELDPAENIRFAFREGKAGRLEDYEAGRIGSSGTKTQPRFGSLESRARTVSPRSSASSTAATPTSGLART